MIGVDKIKFFVSLHSIKYLCRLFYLNTVPTNVRNCQINCKSFHLTRNN